MNDGVVRCWGSGAYGVLGYGNSDDIRDAASAGIVDVGGIVVELAANEGHTCARLDTGSVRCWGGDPSGGASAVLGNGSENIGDDETPASAGGVDVGGPVIALATGRSHTCAVLATGAVRCWGYGDARLGYANTSPACGAGGCEAIGDDETPASAGDVDVGGTVVGIASGLYHNSALLETGAVRCWGRGASGQLGYGNTGDSPGCPADDCSGLPQCCIGDDETPASAGDVDVGGTVVQITAGENHTCALLETGSIRCWGRAQLLGYGDNTISNIGDDETPASAGDVPI